MTVARQDSKIISSHTQRSRSPTDSTRSLSSSSSSDSLPITRGPQTPTKGFNSIDDEQLVRLVQASPTQNEEIKSKRRSLIIQNFNSQHSSFCLPPTAPITPLYKVPPSHRSSLQNNKIVRSLNNLYRHSKPNSSLSSPVGPGLTTAAIFLRSLSPINADVPVQHIVHTHSVSRLRHSFPLTKSTSTLSLKASQSSNRRATSVKVITMGRNSRDEKDGIANDLSLPPAVPSKVSDTPPQPPTHLTSSSLSPQRVSLTNSSQLQQTNSPAPNLQSSIPRPTPVKRKTRVSDLFSRLSSSTASSRAKVESKQASNLPLVDQPVVSRIPTSTATSNIPASKLRTTFFKSRHSTGNTSLSVSKPLPPAPSAPLKKQAVNASPPPLQPSSKTSTEEISPTATQPPTQLPTTTKTQSTENQPRSSPPPPAIPSQMVSTSMKINNSPSNNASSNQMISYPQGWATKPLKIPTAYHTPSGTSSHLVSQPTAVTTTTPSVPATPKPMAVRSASNPINATVTAPPLRSQRLNSTGSFVSQTSSSRIAHAATMASLMANSAPQTSASTVMSPASLIRKHSEGHNSSMMSGRPSSRLRTHRRPGSRTSGSSTSSRAQNTFKVEELKSKIQELEEVLLQEKAERESVYTRMGRINSLESALERERSEKTQLLSKLKAYEKFNGTGNNHSVASLNNSTVSASGEERGSNNRSSTHSDGSSADSANSTSKENSGDEGSSDRATVVGSPSVDEWHRLLRDTDIKTDALESKISALEMEIENRDLQLAARDEDTFGYQILEFQNVITELKLQKEGLRNENETLHGELHKLKDSFKSVKTRSQTLERKLSGKTTKLEVYESQVALAQEKFNKYTEEIEAKNKMLNHKAREIEDLRAKFKSTESHLLESEAQVIRANKQLDLYRVEVEKARSETEQSQAKAQHEKWQAEKQMTILERDNRRSKRIIAALETSLQDLKISLEEKAMENDELNRSIQKVMEQANETIEGAKRHSFYIASPVMSPSRPSSANNNMAHHRHDSHRNSGYGSERNSLNSMLSRRSHSESQQFPFENSYRAISMVQEPIA